MAERPANKNVINEKMPCSTPASSVNNPKEKVVVGGQKITLAQYASRMNIRLLRPADFNGKLRERGVAKKVTVQKVCRVSKDEKDVRAALDEIWQNPSEAQEVLAEAISRNQKVFDFEKTLAK